MDIAIGKKNRATAVFIGGRIRAARARSGVTQARLANELGVTEQLVSFYETGSTRVHACTLFVIAGLLGVEIGFFFPPSGITPVSRAEVEDAKASLVTAASFAAEASLKLGQMVEQFGLAGDRLAQGHLEPVPGAPNISEAA